MNGALLNTKVMFVIRAMQGTPAQLCFMYFWEDVFGICTSERKPSLKICSLRSDRVYVTDTQDVYTGHVSSFIRTSSYLKSIYVVDSTISHGFENRLGEHRKFEIFLCLEIGMHWGYLNMVGVYDWSWDRTGDTATASVILVNNWL